MKVKDVIEVLDECVNIQTYDDNTDRVMTLHSTTDIKHTRPKENILDMNIRNMYVDLLKKRRLVINVE